MLVCKGYIRKIPNYHKNSRETKYKHKMFQYKMSNNTIKITFLLHNYKKSITTRKADGQGLAINYDRQIQGMTNFRVNFVINK